MNIFTSTAAKQRFIALCALGAVLCVAIGFAIGLLSMGNRYPMLRERSFQQFAASYDRVMSDYLNGAEPKQLLDGAAEGMIASLDDPYSSYMTGEKGTAYTQSYEGQFYGIGADIRVEERQFVISSLTKGAPAERGGLLPGDIIAMIDGKSVKGIEFQELLALVRGEEGTTVVVKVVRGSDSKPIEVSLKREAIPVHTVTSELLDGGIGHVTISRFAEMTAEEFKTELDALQKDKPLKGLLLDLRSNPGGLLKPTIEIANILIPDDKVILNVVYKDERQIITYKSSQEKEWTIPIAVLVNGMSASASEVLTAALKESAGAVVIGQQTYGKGVVQTFKQFPDGSVLSLTEAQWKTPSGAWINKKGVTPDHVVALPAYASLRPLAIGTEMKIGSYGEDVHTLQQVLQELGYGPAGAEGYYDKQTAAAMKKFQEAEQLESSGQFNDKSGYLLLQRLREKLDLEDPQLHKGIELLLNQGA
ncbi:S41 family peptidase [Paenibacillus sp. 2TAB19]|uniref:S41 family peptidase n=1 Tax=Paenibacillus sp. 2TAB19 TaxID=3233003 RepID=UPI003F9E4AC1